MKYSNVRAVTAAVFLAGLLCLYYGVSAQAFIWVLFLPLKAVQLFATNVLHLADERFIMFSLAVGIPLTALYWQAWLRMRDPRVRR